MLSFEPPGHLGLEGCPVHELVSRAGRRQGDPRPDQWRQEDLGRHLEERQSSIFGLSWTFPAKMYISSI